MKSFRSLNLLVVAVILATNISYTSAAQKAKSGSLSDAQVKKAIIQESINEYPGNCPCPYNTASNGSRCGKRSAYSRPGGYAPICYASDVTNDMVREWRENQHR